MSNFFRPSEDESKGQLAEEKEVIFLLFPSKSPELQTL